MSPDSFVVRRRLAYSAVPDAVLEHARLSLAARAVLGWMLGRPEGWAIRVGHMVRTLGLSDKTWPRIKRELIAEGFFIQRREKGKGGKFVWFQEVTDAPLFAIPPKGGGGSSIPPKSRDGGGRDAEGMDIAVHIGKPMCREAAEVNSNAAAPSAFVNRKTGGTLHGVEFWDEQERLEIEVLAQKHGEEAILKAAEHARNSNKNGRAYKTAIVRILAIEERQHLAEQKEATRKASLAVIEAETIANIRPEDLEAGRKILDTVRKRREARASTSNHQ